MVRELITQFEALDDPRCDRKVEHKLVAGLAGRGGHDARLGRGDEPQDVGLGGDDRLLAVPGQFDRCLAAAEVLGAQRAPVRKLVAVGGPGDGLGVVAPAIEDEEILAGAAEAIPAQKGVAAEAIEPLDRAQHGAGIC